MASRKAYLVRNLEDVDAASPDDNDSLVWDSGAGKWKPVAISGGGGGGASDFTDLDDVPSSYVTFSGYYVRVSDTENGLIFSTVAGGGGVTTFVELTDVPANYTAASGLGVRVNDDEDALIFEAIVGDFIDLSDTPASYSGEGGKAVQVKSDESGLEFATGGGGGGLLAAFRAQLSSQYSFSARDAWEKLPFDSEDFDTSTYYDPTTNYRWTPPEGICHVSIISDWNDVNANNVYIAIYKNDTAIAQIKIKDDSQGASVDVWDECNGTDYYEAYGYIGSFSNADVNDNVGTKFSGACFTAP